MQLITLVGLLLATALRVDPLLFDENWRIPCGLFIIFVLPGLLLLRILFPHNQRVGVADLPVAVVLSLALWILPSSVSILFRADWAQVQNVFLLVLWSIGIFFLIRNGLYIQPAARKRSQPLQFEYDDAAQISSSTRADTRPSITSRALYSSGLHQGQMRAALARANWLNSVVPPFILLALATLVATLVYHGPRQGDDWLYLDFVQQLLGHNHLEIVSSNGDLRYGLRFLLNDWIFLQALVSRWFDLDPINLVRNILPTAIAPLSLIALYAWAKEFTQSKSGGLLTVIFQLGIYFSFAGFSGWANGFFARSAQDKFLVWLLILPVVLLFFWRFMHSGKLTDLLTYGLALLALASIHAVGLAQFMLMVGGFAVLNFMRRNRFPRRRWALTLLWIIPVSIGALVLRLITSPSHFAVDSTAGALLNLVPNRLVLYPPFYIAHPDLVAQPLILIAFALLPITALYLRTNPNVQFLWGSTLLPLAVLYNPLTAWLMGQAITPFQIWRLTWILPSSLTLAFGIKNLALDQTSSIFHRGLNVKYLVAGGLILLAISISNFNPRSALSRITQSHGLAPHIEDLLRALPKYLCQSNVVLAPASWSDLLPAFSAKANPIARGLATPGNRIAPQVDTFYITPLYTNDLIYFLTLHRVSFVVLPRDSTLNDQLRYLPAFFAPRYANDGFILYQTISPPAPISITQGNTSIIQGNYDLALYFFKVAEREYPENPLVYFGFGWTYAGLGKPGLAEQNFSKALRLAPDNRSARLKLADFYDALGRRAQASQQRVRAEASSPAALQLTTPLNCSASE